MIAEKQIKKIVSATLRIRRHEKKMQTFELSISSNLVQQYDHENNSMKSKPRTKKTYVVDLTDANFKSIVLAGGENFVVEVSAEWSGECFLMSRIIEQQAEKFHAAVRFGRINIDLNEHLAREYGITELPFILFFRQGELMLHHIGLLSSYELERGIKNTFKIKMLSQ